MERLSSGCTGIDKLLKGGFPLHQLNFVYGEASTGKTVLSVQCAIESATRRFKVFYLDSDGSFTPHRLEHLPVKDEVAQRIVVFRPEDFRDQVRITETLESLLTKAPAFLVVDSITGLYRAAFGRRTEVFAYNRELNRELAYLADLARRFELGTLLTGEVHSQPGFGEWSVEPVATRTMRHWSRLILRIRPTPRQGVRECLLEKIDGREVSGPRCLFRVSETGVEDA
jgi:RecA/RadA recombinase